MKYLFTTIFIVSYSFQILGQHEIEEIELISVTDQFNLNNEFVKEINPEIIEELLLASKDTFFSEGEFYNLVEIIKKDKDQQEILKYKLKEGNYTFIP